MDNYIVRIYRQDAEDSRQLAGIVEIAKSGEEKPFSSPEDLIGILTGRDNGTKGKGGKEKEQKPDFRQDTQDKTG